MQDNKCAGQIMFIKCNKIISKNVKKKTEPENILRLSENIKKNGILQPLTVRPIKYGMYEIIGGEKRFQASKLAGIKEIPCIIMNIDEKTSAIINFVENSFNTSYSIFEEAENIKSLIIDYKFTIDELSSFLSLDIFEIINRLKILNFSRENKIKAQNFGLTFKQCVMLTKLDNTELFDTAIDEITKEHMNDFQAEEYISKLIKAKKNTVIFKDLKLFTNTISNAVEKMRLTGIDVFSDKKENDEKIEYTIVISKEKSLV